MTLNALLAGCNQKTSRDPVMEVTESHSQRLESLRGMTLRSSSGVRVLRYEHNMSRVLQIPSQSPRYSRSSCCAPSDRRGNCASTATPA